MNQRIEKQQRKSTKLKVGSLKRSIKLTFTQTDKKRNKTYITKNREGKGGHHFDLKEKKILLKKKKKPDTNKNRHIARKTKNIKWLKKQKI